VDLRADLYTVKRGNLISRRLLQQLVRRHVEFAVGVVLVNFKIKLFYVESTF
jgi:hypothetical protein